MCRDAVCGYVVLAGGKSMNIRQDFEDKTVALILVMDRPNQEKILRMMVQQLPTKELLSVAEAAVKQADSI